MPDTPGTINYPTTFDSAISLFETTNSATAVLIADGGGAVLTVNDTSLFPASGALSVESEIIYYTGKTATTFTGCLRGREGTTTAAHPAGTPVEMRFTSRQRSVLVDAILAIEARLGAGTGDAQSIFTASAAQQIALRAGTAAAPDTTLGPLLKAERLIQVNETVIGGDGSEQLGALHGICVGTAACQTQPVGVYGAAKTSSTDAGPTGGGNDATGIYGIGRVISSAIGYGIGGYAEGRRDTSTGKCYGLEPRCTNQTAVDGAYSPTGASDTMGLWVTAGGQAGRVSGVAIGIGQVLGCQWDVGLGFTKIAGTSAVKNASIRDDGDAATSILINGAHATAAVAIAGQQPLLIGETTRVTASALLEIAGPAATADPIVAVGHTGNSQDYSIFVRNSNGVLRLAVAGGVNSYITGSAAGDAIITPSSTKKLIIGRLNPVLTIDGATAGFGAFGAAPVTRQSVGAAATDAATTQTLANNLRTALINLGWCQT